MSARIVSGLVIAGLISACGGSPEADAPYADLADGTLLVRFETNPNLEDGQCNPNVHYAMKTTEEVIFANAVYIIGDAHTGSGINLINENESGVAQTTAELNMFDPVPQACGEVTIRVQEITCRTANESDASPCPAPQFEGTDMFAGFTGLSD